jgi:ABC-2 type transport system ATP-binding protein
MPSEQPMPPDLHPSETATASPLVEVRDLSKRYGRTLALDRVSLAIDRGERYAILGPNGAGKTTLIHVLCTIHPGDSGTVIVAGHDVHRHPRAARRHLGVVFQEPSLDTRLTVTENLDFHGRIFGVPARRRRERIRDLLELVELTRWKDHLARSLSRGMQRRLEIARALVHDAQLLVLDEPTVGLDAQTRSRMWEYLDELQRIRDLTVLVTTHYIDEVDACDRVCIIDNGKVLTEGTPTTLKRERGQMVVRVRARDADTEQRIRAFYTSAAPEGEELLIPVSAETEIEALLQRFGASLRAFTVERPTLESVFLTLTGRAIRDGAAGARDRLLEFANRGGEHTR